MENERSTLIRIGNRDYEMLLTTKATKEIARRYGGLDKLGDKLLQNENLAEALDELVWLITLLVNQPIQIHNLYSEEKQELLNAETVELLTAPYDLADYRECLMDCLTKGMKRNVESEPDGKNLVAG